jgi:hypothetical protein
MNTFAILPATLLGLLFASHASAASDHALLMKAKKYAEAERAASAVLAKDPANPEALAAKTASTKPSSWRSNAPPPTRTTRGARSQSARRSASRP